MTYEIREYKQGKMDMIEYRGHHYIASFFNKEKADAKLDSQPVKSIRVKEWFIDKNFDSNEAYAINSCSDIKVEKETEKAMYLVFKTDFGTIKSWIPKSCIQ